MSAPSQRPNSAQKYEQMSTSPDDLADEVHDLQRENAALKLEIQALKDLPPNYTYWGTDECEILSEIDPALILFRDGLWDTSGWCSNHGGYPAAVYRGTKTHLKFFDRYF